MGRGEGAEKGEGAVKITRDLKYSITQWDPGVINPTGGGVGVGEIGHGIFTQ
jgi:hypothetical protein